MVTVQDVVRAVASRGAASLGDLESELWQGGHEDGHALLRALDACIDHGYLRLALRREGTLEAPYRVTGRGRKLLAAASRALAAA
jgi:hypothetical protein